MCYSESAASPTGRKKLRKINPPTATAEGTARLRIHKDRHGGIRSRLSGDNVGTVHFNPHGEETTVMINVEISSSMSV